MRTSPGGPGSLPGTGWSSSSPKWRANATCSARVMSWSRKNSTLCFSSSARISAMRSASRAAAPRLTLQSSAPIVQVSGSTLIEPCRATCAGAGVAVAVAVMSFLLWTFASPVARGAPLRVDVRLPYSMGFHRIACGFPCAQHRPVADDAGAFQVAHRRPEVLHGVVLRAAVVPDRDAVLPQSASAPDTPGMYGLADQVVQQQARAGIRSPGRSARSPACGSW